MTMKRIALLLVLAGFGLPFIFQTDFYPFLRYGMFALPPTQETPQELFRIYQYRDSTWQALDPLDIGFYPATFDYLCRNYHYRKEGPQLLHNLVTPLASAGHSPEMLALVRIRLADSAAVAKITVPSAAPGP